MANQSKIIAVYIRISSAQQKTDSQKHELKRWLQSQKGLGPVRWYQDTFTGTTMCRPTMDKLLDDLYRGRLGQIIVYMLDRLGRTASGLTKLFDDLRKYRCNLVSIKDNLDLSTATGRFTANILASVASFENEVRSERILAGQAAARANGKRWGGSVKGRLNSIKPDQVKAIVKMKADGEKVSVICRTVNVNRKSVYRILQRVADGDIKVA